MCYFMNPDPWIHHKCTISLILKVWKLHNYPALLLPAATQTGCWWQRSRRWSFPVCPVGRSVAARWRPRCPMCGSCWRTLSACPTPVGTSFPLALNNLRCLNRLWRWDQRRHKETEKRRMEGERESMIGRGWTGSSQGQPTTWGSKQTGCGGQAQQIQQDDVSHSGECGAIVVQC